MKRVKKLHNLRVEIATPLISHVAPVDVTSGISLTGADSGVSREDIWEVYLDHSTGGTIIVSDAYLAGWDEQRSKWTKIGDLNAGEDITLTATVGYSERVVDASAFSRLAVVDTGDSGTHVYGAIPLEHSH
jgi:hypothetical protein